jgi:hypothetical protein
MTKPPGIQERLETAREFLEAFFDPLANVALICNFDEETEGNPFQKKGKVSTLQKNLKKYVETATAISLNFMDGAGASASNVQTLNLCWTEIDGLSLKKLKTPYPHRVYQRDENHFYLYWKLEPCEATEENKAIHLAINTKLQKLYEGDPQAKDVSRRLRIPGSFHPDGNFYKFQANLSRPAQRPFTLHELAKALKIKPPKDSKKGEKGPENNAEQHSGAQYSNQGDLVAEAKSMLYASFPEVVKGSGRSRRLFLLGIDCHDWGIDKEQALQLAHDVNVTKCKPPETESVVAHQIESAFKYARGKFGELLEDYEQAKDRKKFQQKFIDEQEARDKLKDYVFVTGYDRLINLKNWMEYTTVAGIENQLTSITRQSISLKNNILRRGLCRVVEGLDFMPGKGRFVFRNHSEVLNRFCPLEIRPLAQKEVNKDAVKIFLDHLEFLTTSDDEYRTLLHYIAWQIQNPGEKTMFATLIISHSTGIGKSLLERFFRHVFKSQTGQNYVTTIENHQLTSPYTDYMKDRLVGFVHELGEYDRFNLMFRLKDLITGEYISINEKYARPFQVRNTVNFFFFSNLKNAIRLDEQDRRLFVIYNEKPAKPREYYDRLVCAIDHDFQSIYTFLSGLDISDFSPFERPAMTHGKRQLINLGKSELAIYLDEMKEQKKGAFERGFFTIPDLVEFIEVQGPYNIRNRLSQKAISIWLSENGFVTTRKVGTVSGIRKTWWHSPEVDLPDEPDPIRTESEENAEQF